MNDREKVVYALDIIKENAAKKRLPKLKDRIVTVKAMDFVARHINDEDILYTWLMVGVADGDIEYGDLTDDPGEAGYYAEDKDLYKELVNVFFRCMERAKRNGGLYFDDRR